MSDIFDRLFKLFQMLGADLGDNTGDSAELSAYASGLSLILNQFEEVIREIDVNTATGLGLSLFCEMTGVDGNLDETEKRQNIQKRLSQEYGDYKLNDIYIALADISYELTIMTSRFKFNFNLNEFGTDFDLKELAGVINEFVPPCTVAGFLGDGATFNKWDATDYLFEDYDNLKLPFKILDELG